MRTGRAARQGFTLIELLAVIGIIAILAGMVFAGVTVAKRSALRTRTVSLLQQVSQALNEYRTLNGSYPESNAWSIPGSDYGTVFMSGTAYKAASAVDAAEWRTANLLLVAQLNRGGQSFPAPVVDAWASPLRYRPAKFYPFDDGKPLAIDRDAGVPNRDSFQLWSIGADRIDQYAEDGSDDLAAWR